jgi:hypothetical protein
MKHENTVNNKLRSNFSHWDWEKVFFKTYEYMSSLQKQSTTPCIDQQVTGWKEAKQNENMRADLSSPYVLP